MASLRKQNLDAVAAKLEAVLSDLSWQSVVRNPREALGEDQFNAIVMMDGGDREPSSLTGHVEQRWVEFSIGLMVLETGADTAETLLDAGTVALLDALIDPNDIQLGGLAIDIRLLGIGDPVFGRSEGGARIVGAQAFDFAIQYMAVEGNASAAAP